jgi:hypothetical protein
MAFLIAITILSSHVFAGQSESGLSNAVHTLDLAKTVPGQLNYQGHLADAADSSAVTATLEMTFRLYDSETKGAELWSETHPAVEVHGGLFHVLLGGVTPFPGGLFDAAELWLQTEVGTEILTPRKRLASIAYSQKAAEADQAETAGDADHLEGHTVANLDARWVNEDDLDHLNAADGIPANAVYVANDGKVGVGTTTPLTELDVSGSVNAITYYGDGSNLTGVSGSADADWAIAGDDIYHETGNVGIGTTTPTAPLTIQAGSGDEIFFPSAGNNVDITSTMSMRIGTNSGHGISLHTNNLYRLLVDGDGRVGIGTISPAYMLDVNGDVNATTYYGDGSNLTGISGSGDTDWTIAGSDMYAGVSGNVGIGITSPAYKLDINGSVNAITYYGDGSNLTGISGTTDNDWTINGDDIYHEVGDVGIGTTTPLRRLHVYDGPSGAPTPSSESILLVENDDSACLNFLTPNTEAGVIRFGDTDDYAEGWISYLHSSDVLMFATKDVTSMVLNDDGYLGIGTSAPERRLHVYNGSAGFETAHSNAELVIEDDDNAFINFMTPDTEIQGILFGVPGNTAVGQIWYNHSTDKMRFDTDGSARMYIAGDGNVGIDVYSPAYKLDVNGSVNATTYYGDGSNLTGINDADWTISSNNMYSAVSGNVGIGTSSPVNKLDVEGRLAVGTSYSGTSTAPSNGMIVEGTVGIGTSSPSSNYKLEVAGGGSYGIYATWNGASAGSAVKAINGGTGGDAIQANVTGTGRSAVRAQASSGCDYAIYGSASGATYAGYFSGDLHFTGTMTGGTKSFLIDHPLDPLNKTLMHYCIESPDPLLVYSGKTRTDGDGQAVVRMPDYFAALTKEDEARINLTPVGRPFLTGAEWNAGNTSFTVYGDPGREVFYTVYADRDDPVMRRLKRPVVAEKGTGHFDKGKLLYPEAYGYPASMGVDYEDSQDIE